LTDPASRYAPTTYRPVSTTGSRIQSSSGKRAMRKKPQMLRTAPTYCGWASTENGKSRHHGTR